MSLPPSGSETALNAKIACRKAKRRIDEQESLPFRQATVFLADVACRRHKRHGMSARRLPNYYVRHTTAYSSSPAVRLLCAPQMASDVRSFVSLLTSASDNRSQFGHFAVGKRFSAERSLASRRRKRRQVTTPLLSFGEATKSSRVRRFELVQATLLTQNVASRGGKR